MEDDGSSSDAEYFLCDDDSRAPPGLSPADLPVAPAARSIRRTSMTDLATNAGAVQNLSTQQVAGGTKPAAPPVSRSTPNEKAALYVGYPNKGDEAETKAGGPAEPAGVLLKHALQACPNGSVLQVSIRSKPRESCLRETLINFFRLLQRTRPFYA
eukprot:SAG31_NODE_2113_length_6422_cov_2.860035_4_plen_156_part_00